MGIPQYTILCFRSSGFYAGRFLFYSKPLFEHITHVTSYFNPSWRYISTSLSSAFEKKKKLLISCHFLLIRSCIKKYYKKEIQPRRMGSPSKRKRKEKAPTRRRKWTTAPYKSSWEETRRKDLETLSKFGNMSNVHLALSKLYTM